MTHEEHEEHEEHEDATQAEDTATTLRRARFGALPERIRPEDTVEERPATAPDPARDAYNPDEWMVRYCL
ncbi:hypothetical protein ACIBBD_11095 [Streptomyces sp. NPDC051315]|uniref:hypothetical protein n=1 Tax=Streptomyces sp. NPDC051315 TaxID=3365650 RepID=UPI00378ADC4B